jgi:hypothetical protein
MEYVLARQIDYQHYLLHREARRNERRRRREATKQDKVNAMEAGKAKPQKKMSAPAAVPINAERRKSRRVATSAPPPITQKTETKKMGDRPKKKEQKAKRGRSAAPTTLQNAQGDPSGKVRHWILQQSDFMPKGQK